MSAESGKPKRGTTVKHAPGPGYSKVRYVTGETFPIYIVNLHGHHIRADGEKLVLGQPTTFTTLSEPSDVQGGASLGTWSFEGAKDGFDVIRSYDGDAPIAKVQLLNERDLTANTVTVYFLNPGDKTVTILDGDEVIGTAKVTVVGPTLVEASARISR